MPSYFLSRHTYLCLSPSHVILLDLASGNYLSLPIADARSLSGWITDWPVAGPVTVEPPELLQELLAEGLVSRDIAAGRTGSLTTTAPPPREALEDHKGTRAKVGPLDMYRFLVAVTFGSLALRLVPLRRIIEHVRKRKARARPLDIDKAVTLLMRYESLYAIFFDRHNECLRNSLYLLGFFAQHGVYPDWVFGIRAEPFLAHCWLQHGEVVINDKVRNTACLLPIMTV